MNPASRMPTTGADGAAPGEPHSSLYFGDSRDHWWNDDYVELLAKRLALRTRRKVLDVGSGFGHFGRVWLKHIAPDAELTSLDPEARSLLEAERRHRAFAVKHQLGVSFSFYQGRVGELPFADGAFDLVMAQTLLIHVADEALAVAELTRVLAPGGMLLLAEPNNLANCAASLTELARVDPARALRQFEFELRIQVGKDRLGLGYNSAGETLIRHLDCHRFTEIRQWLWDKPTGIFPPYEEPQVKAELAELRQMQAKGWRGRPRQMALDYFVAGGGAEEAFEALWNEGLALDRELLEGVSQATHAQAGGQVGHIVAAIKR